MGGQSLDVQLGLLSQAAAGFVQLAVVCIVYWLDRLNFCRNGLLVGIALVLVTICLVAIVMVDLDDSRLAVSWLSIGIILGSKSSLSLLGLAVLLLTLLVAGLLLIGSLVLTSILSLAVSGLASVILAGRWNSLSLLLTAGLDRLLIDLGSPDSCVAAGFWLSCNNIWMRNSGFIDRSSVDAGAHTQ